MVKYGHSSWPEIFIFQIFNHLGFEKERIWAFRPQNFQFRRAGFLRPILWRREEIWQIYPKMVWNQRIEMIFQEFRSLRSLSMILNWTCPCLSFSWRKKDFLFWDFLNHTLLTCPFFSSRNSKIIKSITIGSISLKSR